MSSRLRHAAAPMMEKPLPTFYRPACPNCKLPMGLVRLALVDNDYEERFFACEPCDRTDSLIVKFIAGTSREWAARHRKYGTEIPCCRSDRHQDAAACDLHVATLTPATAEAKGPR
jgi:hypothetical protein